MPVGDEFRDVRDGSRWTLVIENAVLAATGVRIVQLSRNGARKWVAEAVFVEYFEPA